MSADEGREYKPCTLGPDGIHKWIKRLRVPTNETIAIYCEYCGRYDYECLLPPEPQRGRFL